MGAVGTVVSYIVYWLIAIFALVRMKHKEVRVLSAHLLSFGSPGL
jgi:hypothetical protein